MDRGQLSVPKLVLVVLGALVALCAVVYGLTVAFEQERQARLVLPQVERLVVRTDNGRVHLRAGRAGEPMVLRRRARWLFGEPALRRRTTSSRVVVEASCAGTTGPCSTDLEVVVPPGVDVTAESRSGDVEAERLRGRIRLRTDAGDVRAEDVRPVSLSAYAVAGDVRVGVRNAPLRIVALTDAGDVEIAVPMNRQYRLDAEYARGELRVEGIFRNDTAARRIVAETGAGDVRVTGR
jgi:hypothetical protein